MSEKYKWIWLIEDKTWTNSKPNVSKAIVKSPENSDLIGNWGFTLWIFYVGVTNGVPIVQNIKSTYET